MAINQGPKMENLNIDGATTHEELPMVSVSTLEEILTKVKLPLEL